MIPGSFLTGCKSTTYFFCIYPNNPFRMSEFGEIYGQKFVFIW